MEELMRPRITKEEYERVLEMREQEPEDRPAIGIPIDQWKKKYDVDYIVEKVMQSLDANVMYDKQDIYKLSGLTPSYPGLSSAIDSYVDYYGKVQGKQHFSHPDTIAAYKKKGRLS